MIYVALFLALIGLLLSALFSGSETGFYRATRLRLLLDSLAGDRISRVLLWLTNQPALFVATTLLGNNLANYLVSLAVVIGVDAIVGGPGHTAELIVPLALSPILFVYGELLPKNLFLKAPNRLLRSTSPLFLGFFVLFFPISVLLWAVSRILGRFVGESPEEAGRTLARREVRRILEEGHEAGILHPAQRALAQGVFAVANRPVVRFVTPVDEIPRVRPDMPKAGVLALAGRRRSPVVLVTASRGDGELLGYFRVIDLVLDPAAELGPPRRLLRIAHVATLLAALTRMQNEGESLAEIVDAQGNTVGLVTAERLREPLFPANTAGNRAS